MSKLLEQINTEKKTKRLGDLVLINQSTITGNFPYKEIEYIDTASVTRNSFDRPQILNINEAPSRAKRLLKDGDTILSTVRPSLCHYGFIKNPKPNTVASTGFVVLTPKNIDPFYLYSYLTQDYITNTLSSIAEATTTTFPAFRPEVLSEMEIKIPDLPTQEKIAEILSAYDSKIENNSKIIKNLELTAQTIFDEWFINFRFPYSTSSRQVGYEKAKSCSELRSTTRMKMVDSEMGEIPEGWKVKPLNDIAEIIFGFNFKAKKFNEEKNGIPVVRIRDVLDGVTKTFTSEIPSDEYKINTGDLLIGMDGTFHCSFWYTEGAYLNQRVARIRSELPGYFIFESVRLQLDFLQKIITGATVGHLANGDIRNFKILIPKDISILNVFENITQNILTLKNEIVNLKESRDQLLAKLF